MCVPFRVRCFMVGVLFLSSSIGAVLAHDPGASTLDVRHGHDRLSAEMTLHSPTHLDERDVLEVRVDGRSLRPDSSRRVQDSTGEERIRLDFVIGPRARTVTIESRIFGASPRGHRQLLTVKGADGEVTLRRLLDAGNPKAVMP